MTPSIIPACLCALLLASASAQTSEPKGSPAQTPAPPAATIKPVSHQPGEWLADVFGDAGLEALRTHGAIILQGRPGIYRLQAVAWKSLDRLARSTKDVQQFSEAFQQLRAGKALTQAGPLPFLALADLSAESLMTAPLQALLEAMEDYHRQWTALGGIPDGSAAAPAPPVLAGPDLFDTSWGKSFAARSRADVIANPAPLAQIYFDEFLVGVRAEPRAAAHFIGYLKDRYHIDVSSLLAADSRAGAASAQLRADLTRYLVDQRRCHGLARIRRQVSEMEKKTALLRDLRDLETVTAVLRGRPGLISELEGVVQAAPAAAAAPALTSAGLHLEKPVALHQHELGDTVALSGAYWVDGLPAKTTVDVEETTYRETSGGWRDVESRTVKRGNGGPYTFSRRLPLEDSDPFTFHSVISAASGNPLSDSVAVPVAKDFELALLKLAAADNQALSCAFPDAVASYSKIEESLAEAASAKTQYRDLLAALRQRREQAARDAAQLARLEAAAKETAADVAPEVCRYDLKRTAAAMALARWLPAGCDHVLAGLRRQHGLIARRAADQQAFSADVRQAAVHRRGCDFALAAEDLARGLAILEADPEARCGKLSETAVQAEADLKAVRADEFWGAAFNEDLRAARAEKAAPQRLARLYPIIARIGSLDDPSCFSTPREQAEKLARTAGADLALSDAAAAQLSADEGLSRTVAEVAAQRHKLVAQAATLQTKQAAEQSPSASTKGATGPAAKTQSATEASQ
jgi:hypothetical protein